LLIAFRRGKNAIWGGLTLGIVVGLVVGILFVIRGNGFDLFVIGKGAISGTILGFIAELLGKVAELLKKRG
jgi:hypothetical protein